MYGKFQFPTLLYTDIPLTKTLRAIIQAIQDTAASAAIVVHKDTSLIKYEAG